MGKQSITMGTTLPAYVAEQVEVLAKEEDRSVSQTIRSLIVLGIAATQKNRGKK